jgi:hypothetical protein
VTTRRSLPKGRKRKDESRAPITTGPRYPRWIRKLRKWLMSFVNVVSTANPFREAGKVLVHKQGYWTRRFVSAEMERKSTTLNAGICHAPFKKKFQGCVKD